MTIYRIDRDNDKVYKWNPEDHKYHLATDIEHFKNLENKEIKVTYFPSHSIGE